MSSSGLDSKHILVDVELDAQTDDDDVRYHEAKIRRLLQELCPDAHVSVRSGGVRWFDLEKRAA